MTRQMLYLPFNLQSSMYRNKMNFKVKAYVLYTVFYFIYTNIINKCCAQVYINI